VWLVPRPDFVADAGAFPPPSFRESAPPEVSTAMDLFDCWGLFGVGDGDGAASVSESTGGDESSGEELFAPAPFPPPAARRTSAGDAMLLDLICGRYHSDSSPSEEVLRIGLPRNELSDT
jgi:hypothetical protein